MSSIIEPTSPPAAGVPRQPAADVAALRDMLATIRRQTRAWIWLESIAWLGLAAVALFWGSLALDWCVEPPRWARAVLLVAAALWLGLLVARKLLGRLTTDLGDASLAVVVERAHPSFRDSLSTTIELADQSSADINPDLLVRTAAEAGAHLGQVRPEKIFRRRELAMLAFSASVAVASVAALAVAKPAVAGMWVRRLALLGDEAWPRRVRLVIDGFPDGVRKVARGSDVDVIVHAQAADGVPELVDLRWRVADAGVPGRLANAGRRGVWHVDRMGTRGGISADGRAFGHVLKAVNDSIDIEIRGGDARLRHLRVEVLDPPALEQLAITSTPPAYLGGAPRIAPPSRIVPILRGSRVSIACRCTKPLSSATMVMGGGGQGVGETVLATLPAGGASGGAAAASAEDRTIVGSVEALDADRTIVVRFTDTDGLTGREPVTFTLSAVADEPPQVVMRLRGISTAVTPRARLPLVGSISDDHGLKEATIRLNVPDGGETAQHSSRVRAGDTVVEIGAEAPEIVNLEPLGLAVGRRIDVSVAATDACTLDGAANTGTSDVWSLDVVAPEALVAMLEAREIMLRRRYESCFADLTQARDGFATPSNETAEGGGLDPAAARLADATARAGGETKELAESFRGIRLEFDNNQLITPELEARLIGQIADPMDAIAVRHLPELAALCRSGAERHEVVRRADEVLARMRAVLDTMMELESFNEVVELLRGMIRTQEQIRVETLEQQKRRAREALERP